MRVNLRLVKLRGFHERPSWGSDRNKDGAIFQGIVKIKYKVAGAALSNINLGIPTVEELQECVVERL